MRLPTSDYQDFKYTINFFRVEHGGVLRVKLADHTVRTVAVATGGCVNLPIKRIYATGTTARGFTNDLSLTANSPVADEFIPYAVDPTEFPCLLLTRGLPLELIRGGTLLLSP